MTARRECAGGRRPRPEFLLARTNSVLVWRRLLAIRHQSRLLTSLILLFVTGYFTFAFGLFYKGLRFIGTFPGLGSLLTERLLFLLFAFLFFLLLFSNLVISYTNLFRNRETSFLLSLPISTGAIFRWKFLETTILASWAFLFLIAPLLAAFGLTRSEPWHFYLATIGLIALFLFLPAYAGVWISTLVARFLDRRRFQLAVFGLGLAGAIAAFIWLKPEPVTDEMLETRVVAVLDRLLQKTQFSQFPFLPSYWVASGVLNWTEGALAGAGFFALVMASHVLFFGAVVLGGPRRNFYEGYNRVHSRGGALDRWRSVPLVRKQAWRGMERIGIAERASQALFWVRPDARAVLVKDARLFWRDTSQWGQTLVLFGLLSVYIINLRHFSRQLTNPFWLNLVAYLNLGACSLNLATLTTRFVYPQFSLEGKRLWIIGMAPLGLRRILWAKLGLATSVSLVVTPALIWFSCWMLQMPWTRIFYFAGSVAVMSAALNSLALGLGVLYPNLKEENPTKIVSGFGGTFCLVLSFFYIASSVAILAFGSPWSWVESGSPGPSLLMWALFLALSWMVGGVPFVAALRRTANGREFI